MANLTSSPTPRSGSLRSGSLRSGSLRSGKGPSDAADAADTLSAPSGEHREALEGDWLEMGQLQIGYLRAVGLQPEDTLLDIGCGPLRAGVHFVDFLDAGNYFGLEANLDYLTAGLEIELPLTRGANKLPGTNVRLTDSFDATPFGTEFDMVLAHGLFPSLTLNEIRLCLFEAARVTTAGSRFFATFFEAPDSTLPADVLSHGPHNTTSVSAPFHYRIADLENAARGLGWKVDPVGEWGHPLGERLVCFRRLPTLLRSPRHPDASGARRMTKLWRR